MTRIIRMFIDFFSRKSASSRFSTLKVRYIFFFGLLIFFLGFIYDIIFAGLPYQDPTLEMQQSYEFHSTIAGYVRMGGLVIALLSGCLVCIGWLVFGKNKR